MRRIPFRNVLDDVLALVGQRYDSSNQDLLDTVAVFINRRAAVAWDYWPWPELTFIEERAFAEDWDDDVDYAAGDVVWEPTGRKYYEALRDTTGDAPASSADDWEETDVPAQKLVKWQQRGERKIGKVRQVCKTDPNLGNRILRYGWMESSDGVVVPVASTDTIWLVFTEPPSRYGCKVWSSSGSYVRYDVVFYPGTEESDDFPQNGECYLAELDVEGNEFWQLIPFPQVIGGYVTLAAAADLMRHYRKDEAADRMEARAQEELERQSIKSSMDVRLNVVVHA